MDINEPVSGAEDSRFADAEARRLIDTLSAAMQPTLVSLEEVRRLAGVDANNQALQRMCFRVGELGLLFPWEGGREVLLPPRVSRIPNTATWFLGLANVRGGLVPVVDTARALGVKRNSGVPAYLLIFGHGETAMGLLIDGLPRLLSIETTDRLSDMPAGPPLLEGSVVAAYRHGDRIWFDLDLDVLFDTLSRNIAL